jgi:hypothetical protein
MNPLQRALIEKLGHDHGFEHVLASDSAAVEGVLEAYEALVSRASLAQLYNIEQYVLDRKKKGNVTWI